MVKIVITIPSFTLNFELLNLIIAVLALLVSIYSIYYTKKFNRPRIDVDDCVFLSDQDGSIVHRFKVHNISPVIVTLEEIEFFDPYGNIIKPYHHRVIPTYTNTGSLTGLQVPDLPNYDLYESWLNDRLTLVPHSYAEFAYYFDALDDVIIDITCKQRIRNMHKTQSFVVHFNEDDE